MVFSEFQKKYEGRVKHGELLSKHTTLHVGGPAKYYFEAKTREEIIETLAAAKSDSMRVAILGGGSNVLFADSGFDGLVMRPMLSGLRIQEDGSVRAEAGVLSSILTRKTAEAGLAGFEWAATLPGTIGGAVRGNAGCFGGEIKDSLSYVEIVRSGEVITIPQTACQFAYRDSCFKNHNNDDVILAASFELKKSESTSCLAKVDEIFAKRKATQPQGVTSAGCMFKNFEYKDENEIEKLKSVKQIPDAFLQKKMIPVGWLIEQAELKGYCIGGVCVSEAHGNFLITKPGTTADHILQLIAAIKTRVRNQFGIQLQEEVQLMT
ncbi:MAG: UDP-N-acetylmuramate dehydrogenase [bacterium]